MQLLTAHGACCPPAAQLGSRGLVSFVANGAILPRRSGASDLPMPREQAVAFTAPPSLAVTLTLPNGGDVTGMGVPKGVTLIVGGGFHGKSTLLEALQLGVYDKAPGDGREGVVTDPHAVKVSRPPASHHITSHHININMTLMRSK